MIIIDLTLAKDNNDDRRYHGGGQYAISAAIFISERSNEKIMLAFKHKVPEELEYLLNYRNIQCYYIKQEENFRLPEEYDRDDTILFLPNPYIYMRNYDPPKNARIWITIHGLRSIELTRLRSQAVPVQDFSNKNFLTSVYEHFKFMRKIFSSESKQNKTKQSLFAFLKKMKSNDKILTVSDHTEWSIRLYDNYNAASSIHHAPPLEPFIAHNSNMTKNCKGLYNRKGILLLSGERKEKNINRVLKAISNHSKLLETCIKEDIYITGSYSFMKSLPDFLNNKVKIIKLGYCSSDHLEKIMQTVSVLVFPSINEGYGIPPVTAFKFGTPVLASPVTSISEIASDAALYANPFDTGEIASKLLHILNDQDLREHLRSNGFKRYSELKNKALQNWYNLLKMVSN